MALRRLAGRLRTPRRRADLGLGATRQLRRTGVVLARRGDVPRLVRLRALRPVHRLVGHGVAVRGLAAHDAMPANL